MAQQQLTVDVVDPAGLGVAEVEVTIASAVSDHLLAVGDDVVLPAELSGVTDSTGRVVFSLLPTSATGSRYVAQVGERVRAIFAMPDSASTLAAAIGYPHEDELVPPVQGWRLRSGRPDTPVAGDGHFDTDDHTLEIYTGNEWVAVGGSDYDDSELRERVTYNETDIAANTDDIAAAQTARSALSTRIARLESPRVRIVSAGSFVVRVASGVEPGEPFEEYIAPQTPPVAAGDVLLLHSSHPDDQLWGLVQAFADGDDIVLRGLLGSAWLTELAGGTSLQSRIDTNASAIAALQAGGITVSTTAPTSPSDGALWFNPANQHLATYDADTTTWVAVVAGGDHDRIDANEANVAVNTANIQGEVNQRIAGDAALNDRVLALEGIDTSEQLVSPVEYNAADHTLILNHQDGTTETVTLGDVTQVPALTTSVDDVTILWYAGLGSETEVYEQAAQSADGSDTPDPDVINHAVNGYVLRNNSHTYVAGLSFIGDGLNSPESVFVLSKLNLSGTPSTSYWHTLFSSYELNVAVQAQANRTRVAFRPTAEPSLSSTTIDIPVAIGLNGVGDAVLGIQLTENNNAIQASVAINGVTSGTSPTTIGYVSDLHWSTRTNVMVRWGTPLQHTGAQPTQHFIGSLWDTIVGRKDTPWSHTAFTALTSQTDTATDNRTRLYGGAFNVGNAPIFSQGVHWSERATIPADRDAPAAVHHLRTYVPVDRVRELLFDVAVTRQVTHDPQTYLVLPDRSRARRCLIDLGDQTIGAEGSSADVIVNRAKLDEWVIADRALTMTQLRGAPIWQLCAGWPSNYYIDAGEHHTWAVALVRANATDDGCPAGCANYLCVTGYLGEPPNGASERWLRVGVRT